MKKVLYSICIALFVMSCSSPVEEYIKNDFARVVREDALTEEVQSEINRVVSLLENMADEANPDAKQSKELEAKAKKLEREIETRMNNYNRTGSYSYIINIYNDAERCDEMYAKANRMAKKAKPYTNHKDKQVANLIQALSDVDAKALMNSQDLVKDDSLTVEGVFNKAIGVPANMITLTEEELEEIATAYLTNYFIDNPTQTVLAYKHQKDNDRWYITLSDDTQYFLSAIKSGKGEYVYQYVKTDDPFSTSATTSSDVKTKNDVKSGDIDKFLDKYEKFAATYAKQYKKLYEKSLAGDLTVMGDLGKLAEQAEEFVEEWEDFDGNMTSKQLERYTQITLKLSSALME